MFQAKSGEVEVLSLQNQGLLAENFRHETQTALVASQYNAAINSRGFRLYNLLVGTLRRGSMRDRVKLFAQLTHRVVFRLLGRPSFLRPRTPLAFSGQMQEVYGRHEDNRKYVSFVPKMHDGSPEAWESTVTALKACVDSPDANRALEETQYRYDIWSRFVNSQPSRYLSDLREHDGQPGPRRIIVFGPGGIGDAIQLSALIAALKKKFTPCEITLLHSRSVVTTLYKNNRNLACAAGINSIEIRSLIKALVETDYFDLVVDTRYVPIYYPGKNARLTDEEKHWMRGNWESIPLISKFLDRFPDYNNILGRSVKPHSMLDLQGRIGGLGVTAASQLYFFPEMEDAGTVDKFELPRPYITIHDGMDPEYLSAVGVPRGTKQLPKERWAALVSQIQKIGIYIVQVGSSHESKQNRGRGCRSAGEDEPFATRICLKRRCYSSRYGRRARPYGASLQ